LRCPCEEHMSDAWTKSFLANKLRPAPHTDLKDLYRTMEEWNSPEFRQAFEQYVRWKPADIVVSAAKRAAQACAAREHQGSPIVTTALLVSDVALNAIGEIAEGLRLYLEVEKRKIWLAIRDALVPWALGLGDPVLETISVA